jgi:ribosomal protein L34E
MQQEDVCELPSAKQLEQLKKQDKKKKLVNVSEDVLASINTNRGQNLADLSKSHKVMLCKFYC